MYWRRLGLSFISLQVGPQGIGCKGVKESVSRSIFGIKGIANQETGCIIHEMKL